MRASRQSGRAGRFGLRREAKRHAALGGCVPVQKRCRRCALPPQSKISFARHHDGKDAKELTLRANQRMNQSIKPKNLFTATVLLIAMCMFPGCIIYPHTSEKSPNRSGKILDISSRDPVAGAKIFITGHPSNSCRTDQEGNFFLRSTHNFHLFVLLANGCSGSRGKIWGDCITIRHPQYKTFEESLDDLRSNTNGVFFLMPTNYIPVRYPTNNSQTSSSSRASGTNRFILTNQVALTNGFK